MAFAATLSTNQTVHNIDEADAVAELADSGNGATQTGTQWPCSLATAATGQSSFETIDLDDGEPIDETNDEVSYLITNQRGPLDRWLRPGPAPWLRSTCRLCDQAATHICGYCDQALCHGCLATHPYDNMCEATTPGIPARSEPLVGADAGLGSGETGELGEPGEPHELGNERAARDHQLHQAH